MKTLVIALTSLFLASFSVIASADKIVISGEPVVVEKQADVYVPATTVTTSDGYYFFSVDNSKRVCYKEVQPSLAKVDLGLFAVKLGNDVVSLHCYDYSPDYFVVH